MVSQFVLPVKDVLLVKGSGACYIGEMAHRFELVGGDLSLDFVNTVHDWTSARPRDYIPHFNEALRFGTAAGGLSPREERQLRAKRAGRELRRLHELRSRLERIFRARVVKRRPLPSDLDALSRDATDAARAARLKHRKDQVTRQIAADIAGASTLRLRVVESALALLTSESFQNVKTCPSCGWFFLDTSKNKSRRWCSMASCGSNAKARRYYWRSKAKSSA